MAYVPHRSVFTYFAGCCWSALKEIQDRAAELVGQDDTT